METGKVKTANAPIKVNREAIKALCLIHGVKRAAEMAGLNVNTVKTWAYRERWKIEEVQKRGRKAFQSGERKPSATHSKSPEIQTVSPSETIRDALTVYREQTTIGLAKYAHDSTQEANSKRVKLPLAKAMKAIADIHCAVHGSNTKQGPNILNLAVLVGSSSAP